MKTKVKFWVILVLGVVMAVRTGGNVWRLYQAGNRVKEAKTELTQLQAKNEELQKRLAEVNSPAFVEQEAREKLGYGKDGEVVLVLPDQTSSKSQVLSSKQEPNWKLWWNLYIGI